MTMSTMKTLPLSLPMMAAILLLSLMLVDLCHAERGIDEEEAFREAHIRPLASPRTFFSMPNILLKDQPELIEPDSSEFLPKEKRSSVSWLLAAAIRMCQEYPDKCLRQRRLHENYQQVKRTSIPSSFSASAIQYPWQRR